MERRQDMFDWLIIGGGVHGTLMANFLISNKKVKGDKLGIVDPCPSLLHCWKMFTSNCGMRFMRSTLVHHLDVNPFSLKKFSKRRKNASFTFPYNRPSIRLFNDHCQFVIEKNTLDKYHIKAKALDIHVKHNHLEIETDIGILKTKRLLLATGIEQLNTPEWSKNLPKQLIQHIFDPCFHRQEFAKTKSVVVVGSGITAAQTAIAIAQQCEDTEVNLIAKHKPQIHQFDSDPGWIGGYLREFQALQDYQKRREIIQNARNIGSMPKDVATILKNMVAQKRIRSFTGVVESVTNQGQDLKICMSQQKVQTKKIVLATGFDKSKIKGKWLEQVVERYQLPQASCGGAIVSKNLHWANNIFVTGPLAELEIGPVSRNIVGARLAARRIVDSA